MGRLTRADDQHIAMGHADVTSVPPPLRRTARAGARVRRAGARRAGPARSGRDAPGTGGIALYPTEPTTTRPPATTSRPEFAGEGSRRTTAGPSMLPFTVRVPAPLKRWFVFEDGGVVGSKARARPA